MIVTTPPPPPPGSSEATARGCTCNGADNHFGRGFIRDPEGVEDPAFWVRRDCPLHRPARRNGA